jgi:hypothetical protein
MPEPARKGDRVQITVQGTVAAIQGNRVDLFLDGIDEPDARWHTRIMWQYTAPHTRIVQRRFEAGDYAEVEQASGDLVRAMFVRHSDGDEAWVTGSGDHLRDVTWERVRLLTRASRPWEIV